MSDRYEPEIEGEHVTEEALRVVGKWLTQQGFNFQLLSDTPHNVDRSSLRRDPGQFSNPDSNFGRFLVPNMLKDFDPRVTVVVRLTGLYANEQRSANLLSKLDTLGIPFVQTRYYLHEGEYHWETHTAMLMDVTKIEAEVIKKIHDQELRQAAPIPSPEQAAKSIASKLFRAVSELEIPDGYLRDRYIGAIAEEVLNLATHPSFAAQIATKEILGQGRRGGR